MKLLPLLSGGLLLLLPACQNANGPAHSFVTAENSYRRAVLPVPEDFFSRILKRMQEPYILAGEDVEMLHQHTERWFETHTDSQALTELEKLKPKERTAFDAWTRKMSLPQHPRTKALLQLSRGDLFPAEKVTAEDAG